MERSLTDSFWTAGGNLPSSTKLFLAPYKVIRNPGNICSWNLESRKCLRVESRNLLFGIRNPGKQTFWNLKSTEVESWIQYLGSSESASWNPEFPEVEPWIQYLGSGVHIMNAGITDYPKWTVVYFIQYNVEILIGRKQFLKPLQLYLLFSSAFHTVPRLITNKGNLFKTGCTTGNPVKNMYTQSNRCIAATAKHFELIKIRGEVTLVTGERFPLKSTIFVFQQQIYVMNKNSHRE